MQVLSLLQDNYQWALSVLILLLYPKLVFLSLRVLDKTVGQREDSDRLQRVKWLLKTSLFVMILLGIMMIWGIELRGLLVIGSSLFALIGVALFASWSLLSNITSFLVLFIQNHCRIGSWVKIIDGGNFIEGRLVDMTLFNVVLETLDGNRVLYPNNLFIVRPVVVLAKAPEKSAKKTQKKQLPKLSHRSID
ncbi:mechanosensitive ion channel [Vibrio sp. V31_P5A7T61]|uniref:mechanosensitive ion channel domain-containing protein n=1 Tax=unclassified Vibrio TaxID=2614977 RepID=UPI001372AC3E|nr:MULTISPECIES: mechanosensitive ion channel domain-containing protein [unclassified Vibrio]NAW60621.1 mechanosensitive ion channel [Vibrio sp. V31_P5A7T61]NAX00939.1 mechanosensitive ion channel [Vibrio sp. V34_P3A8T189]NAX06890.1 mechanosensitive ion channel [Vibrio sp. V40_P2S30T141]NAX62471.1 mechanosensitive ion channel [Vibrio sp. V32_P6A28T40]